MTPEERCIANLHAIADAIARYKADHNGEMPVYFVSRGIELNRPGHLSVKELEEMSLYPKYIKDPSVFLCPSCPKDTLVQPLGRKFKMSYGYHLSPWFYPGNKIKGRSMKEIFYKEIVPNYEVRVTQCSCHPRRDSFVILFDDLSVTVRPTPYTGTFWRTDLFPEDKEEMEWLRRRGLDPRSMVYPKHRGGK